jgi:c-di-GMP phosphodiesterase
MPNAFVARQPIFNHKLEVVGYELLFRGGYVHEAPIAIEEHERATATVVLNSFTELELRRIVGHKTAWVNVSREFLLDGLAQAFPPKQVGLEIREALLKDGEVLPALRELKAQGFQLALDNFSYQPESEPALELFDVVKLSMLELGREQLNELAGRLRSFPGTVLAEQVGTHPDHEFCVSAGADLFQGYFFCRPAVVVTRGIAANRLAMLQIVAALNDPSVELSDVEALIARDVALSLRLLRYVNSAFFGLRGEVRSIGQALALLGIENLRRWATLTTLASIDDKPTELTITALIRARFCELAGEQLVIASAGELFTLGLFSVIDAMMDAPMHDVVESLPFAEDMREALAHRRGKRGQLLDCVVALETGEIGKAPAIINRAGELYLESIMWANHAAEALFGELGGAAAPLPAGQSFAQMPAPAGSKAPPGLHFVTPAAPAGVPGAPDVPIAVPVPEVAKLGLFARLKATVAGWFGGGRRDPAPVAPVAAASASLMSEAAAPGLVAPDAAVPAPVAFALVEAAPVAPAPVDPAPIELVAAPEPAAVPAAVPEPAEPMASSEPIEPLDSPDPVGSPGPSA